MVVALIISNIVGMYLSYNKPIYLGEILFLPKYLHNLLFWLFTQTFYQFKTNLHLRFVVAIC